MNFLRTLTVIAAASLISGCAERGYYSTTGRPVSGRYYSQVDLDRSLETSIRANLNQYGNLSSAAANVAISAQNGTVTLSGPVRNEQDRQMIDTVARNTSGVTSVIDQMQPGLAPTSSYGLPPRVYVEPPVDVRTPLQSEPIISSGPGLRIQPATEGDRWMAQNVADAFRSGAVPLSASDNITATVRNNVVYLQGLVNSEGQRQAIRSAVEHLSGVAAVYDQLQVK